MSSHVYKVYRYWSPSGKSYIGQTCNSLDFRAGKDGIRYHWRYYKEGDKQCQLKLWLQGSKS